MDTAPNTIECWNLRDETPKQMKILVGTHPSPKDGLPDRATPDCGKKCTSQFFTYTQSSQSPERSTAPNKLQLLASAERLGEESNSPLSLQVPDVMYALDGSGILYKLKSL